MLCKRSGSCLPDCGYRMEAGLLQPSQELAVKPWILTPKGFLLT